MYCMSKWNVKVITITLRIAEFITELVSGAKALLIQNNMPYTHPDLIPVFFNHLTQPDQQNSFHLNFVCISFISDANRSYYRIKVFDTLSLIRLFFRSIFLLLVFPIINELNYLFVFQQIYQVNVMNALHCKWHKYCACFLHC